MNEDEATGIGVPDGSGPWDTAPMASGELFGFVYSELRQLAAAYLRSGPPGATLQPTALVHEAFLRVGGRDPSVWKNRAHFLAVCAVVMRGILTDHVRMRRSAKRGGAWDRVSLSGVANANGSCADVDIEAVHQALEKLASLNPRHARVVECRFFSGMTVDEVAVALKVSKTTIEGDWRMASAWLSVELARHLTA